MSPQRQAADLWIRNIQLAFFSLLPAGLAVISPDLSSTAPRPSGGVFANFGVWSWSVVLIQVAGGLVTAVVIKYSDKCAARAQALADAWQRHQGLRDIAGDRARELGGGTPVRHAPDDPLHGRHSLCAVRDLHLCVWEVLQQALIGQTVDPRLRP